MRGLCENRISHCDFLVARLDLEVLILQDYLFQWDGVENKSTVAIYGGGALVAIWLSSTIVGAINSVPLVSEAHGPIYVRIAGRTDRFS